MATEAPNYYQILGVERTADDRAVKKAYFGLVRRFPPETHPEEFKRIREAYETLSDPVARERYDAVEPDYREYGEAIGATLRLAADKAKGGKEPEVQALLKRVLDEKPDLLVAQEMIGLSYLRSGENKKAQGHFEALVRARPEEALHHLHLGYALRNQDQPGPAEAAFLKARQLRPDHLNIRLALADLLCTRKKFEPAYQELEDALTHHPKPGPERLALELRKVEVRFLAGAGPKAEAELDQFVARIRKDPDKELWKYASSQLAAIAAKMFVQEQAASANALLARCEKLNPASPVEHPYPMVATIDPARLPQPSRAWLASQAPGERSPTLAQGRWSGPLVSFVGASGFAVLVWLMLFSSPTPWDTGGIVVAAIAITLATTAMALALRFLWRVATSDLGSYMTIHPLFLLQVRPWRIKAWPLVALADVRVVRHTTNGVYTHTQVEARFGRATRVGVSIRNESYAKGWADYLLECRRRALELMFEGFLDALQETDVIPKQLLHGAAVGNGPSPARRFLPDPRFALAVAAASLVLLVAAVPYGNWLAEDADWRSAVRQASFTSYGNYLLRHPKGRHAVDAAAEQQQRYDAALAAFKAELRPEAPGSKAFVEAVAALGAKRETVLPFVVEIPIDAGLPVPLPATKSAREHAVVDRFRRVVARTSLAEVIQVVPVGKSAPAGSAVLSLKGKMHADGAPLESAEASLTGLRLEWEATLTAAGKPVFTDSGVVLGPEELRLPRPEPRPDALAAWTAQSEALLVDRVFEDLAWRLADAFGLGGAAEPTRVALAAERRAAAQSPYRSGR